MAFTFEEIAAKLAEIVRKNPDGVGWYGVEMRCPIPRSDFPDGLNVKTILEGMVAAGMLTKTSLDGKDRYVTAAS